MAGAVSPGSRPTDATRSAPGTGCRNQVLAQTLRSRADLRGANWRIPLSNGAGHQVLAERSRSAGGPVDDGFYGATVSVRRGAVRARDLSGSEELQRSCAG